MMKTKQLALCAMLVATALVLSYFERFIPLNLLVPLPGVKLGLANIVTMLALYFLGVRYTVTILLLRCVLGAVFSGSITALAYSLTGGALSLLVMMAARHVPFLSIFGVSVLGAAAHNIGQILAAMALLGSTSVLYYLPFLLLVAVPSGLLTGATSSVLFRALLTLRQQPPEGAGTNRAGDAA